MRNSAVKFAHVDVYPSNFSRTLANKEDPIEYRSPQRLLMFLKHQLPLLFRSRGFLERNMQPSIKMFFKSKQPVQEADDNLDEKSSQKSESGSKRSADDECKLHSKRQAVSSPSGTPVKSLSKASTNETTPVLTTPTKRQLTQENKKPTNTTPLIDITVVIRKKISDGAYALHENIGVSWFRALQNEFDKPYFKKLSSFVQQERRCKTVFPPENKVYTWTHHHNIRDTRVIILGQDPYHAPGQAHGLSFSVPLGVKVPPSLVNIYKELENDIPGFKSPKSGDLTGWAKQGVLLLNTCLSVNQGQANSHQGKGWEIFTDAVISWLSKNTNHKLVFILWGRPAQRKVGMIDKKHKILTSVHPSPLSAHGGFFGCAHFSQTNSFLRSQKLPEIDWTSL